MEVINVSLGTLGGGAASEMFEDELAKVVANMLDLNAKQDAVRSVTFKVTMKPSKDRSMCDVSTDITSKMAGPEPHETMFFIGKEEGRCIASEYNPKQGKLPGIDTKVDPNTGEITDIRAVK